MSKTIAILAVIFCLFCQFNTVEAQVIFNENDVFDLVQTPFFTEGPFRAPLVHKSTHRNPAGGRILNWFNLKNGEDNFYRPFTGEFQAHFDILDGADPNSNVIGSLYASSNNLFGANFNQFDGDPIGDILFNYSFDPNGLDSPTFLYLDRKFNPLADGSFDVLKTFLDREFVTASDGTKVNSLDIDGDFLTMGLWGANDYSSDYDGYYYPEIGIDAIIKGVRRDDPFTAVPEPSTYVLFLMLGALGLWRNFRGKKASATAEST